MTNHQWAQFSLSDFFVLEKGNQNNMASLSEGSLPLVSARKCDNGYKQFVAPNKKHLYQANIITLNNDGDGGAGIAYYQPHQMALDSHVTALIPKLQLNKFHLLFVSRCITKQRERFGHGYSLNSTRLRIFKYMLPITEQGQPDWQFMEDYMKGVEQEILKPTIDKLCKQLIYNQMGGLRNCNLLNHKWKEFDFVDIFEIRKGFYNKKPPCYENGNIPFIGATDSNNGITGFSDYETIDANSKIGYGPNESIDRKLFPGNAICVTNNGSVGYAYYQPSEFTCTHDVNPLYLKNIALNRHLAMFLIACIEKQRVCFTYARKWRPKRMVHSKLMLPIDEAEQPDWSFMENFMKEVENDALNVALKYFVEKQSITPPL